MKRSYFPLLATLCCISSSVLGEPTKPLADAELVALAKGRAELERVLPLPQKMKPTVSALCRSANAPVNDPGLHGDKWNWIYTKSPEATDALWDPHGKFPVGSVLLKEKCGDKEGKETELFTGMLKRDKGYNASQGDWEYFVIDGAAAKLQERGMIQSCIECHSKYAAGDFASRAYLSEWSAVRDVSDLAPKADPTPSVVVIPASSKDVVWLHSSFAKVVGKKLQYENKPEKNTLGFWTQQDDFALWAFSLKSAGSYEVEVLQGCGKGSGGAEVEVSANGQKLAFTVEDTGHFQNFKARTIGNFTFDQAGEFVIEVRPKSKPGVAVMDLRRIVLRKIADGKTGAR